MRSHTASGAVPPHLGQPDRPLVFDHPADAAALDVGAGLAYPESMEPSELYRVPLLYDALCPMLTADDPELAWWRWACGTVGATRVLELGAGTGRVAIPLAEGGLEVTALDASEAMLARGRARAAARGADLRWVRADLRDFDLGETFDAVLVPFNTLCHLHEREAIEAALARIAAHLAPGGVLALAVFAPDARSLARSPAQRVRLTPEPLIELESGRVFLVDETVDYDPISQTTGARLHFVEPGAGDFLVVSADLRALYPAELEALLHYNGFEGVARHGDWDGSALDAASPLQLTVARPRL